jgi:hypothetical protein
VQDYFELRSLPYFFRFATLNATTRINPLNAASSIAELANALVNRLRSEPLGGGVPTS